MSLRITIRKQLGAALGESRLRRGREVAYRQLNLLAKSVAPAGLDTSMPKGSKTATPTAPRATANTRPTSKVKPTAPAVKPVAIGEPNDRRGGWTPPDPFVPFPPPSMSRHDVLRALHRLVQPSTYLEIGVSNGQSLALSRTKSIGVDPAFQVDRPLHCDLHLVRDKSDAFFARPDPLAHFDGKALDFAFIDGMHLSEYALRDFMNVERHMNQAGIVLLDDMLPRNPLEAARDRQTAGWTGDVYKVLEILQRRRPDLVVLLLNTHPTGTALVVGADPQSDVLWESYDDELPYLTAEDPQAPPEHFMDRSVAVDPEALMRSDAWDMLARARHSGDHTLLAAAKDALRATPLTGADPARQSG